MRGAVIDPRVRLARFGTRSSGESWHVNCSMMIMIRKLPDGRYRLYSRNVDRRTNRRKNLGTFTSREAAEKHERAVQYFKRRG